MEVFYKINIGQIYIYVVSIIALSTFRTISLRKVTVPIEVASCGVSPGTPLDIYSIARVSFCEML